MPKMQVRGTQSFFGDVQDVRYAENAGTWYPELFRRCTGCTVRRQCRYVVPRAFSAMFMDVRYADNAGTWYPELVGAASVLCRVFLGKILMAVGVFHRLRRVTERQ